MSTTTESTPLLDPSMASAGATAGIAFVNQSADKIKKARMEGPMSYRIMAFIGGLAMIVSNCLAILDRFFSFNFSGSLIAIYGTFFGIVITILEGPRQCNSRLQSGVRYYAKFLEFTWGRGALYFFVGSLQISNWNMLDWAVGGWMCFVGITAISVGISTARQLRLLKFSVKEEKDLKAKWSKFDTNGDSFLDVKELTEFAKDSGLDMTKNEIAAAFLALDRNFDEKVGYEEFYMWWMSAGAYGAERGVSV